MAAAIVSGVLKLLRPFQKCFFCLSGRWRLKMLVLTWQQGLVLCSGTYALMYTRHHGAIQWIWLMELKPPVGALATTTVDLIFERPTYQ